MNNRRSIFYNSNLEIDLNCMNQILQSILCFSDFIWINNSATISSNLSTDEKQRLELLFLGLENKGKIRFWGFPHQNEKKGKIIQFQEYRTISDKINETFLTEKDLLPTISYGLSPINLNKEGIETTSKIISVRKEYWSLALADSLGSDRVMVGPEFKSSWPNRPQKLKYPLVESPIIETILKDFMHIPDLTYLNLDDIIKLQRHSKPFREKIESISMFDFNLEDEGLKEATNKLTEAIWEYNIQYDVRSLGKGLSKDMFYAISGYICPYLATLPLGERFLNWLNIRRKNGYAIYMSELKGIIKKRTDKNIHYAKYH